MGGATRKVGKVLGQAVLLTVVGSVVGLVVNAARSEGLALVADKPYELYVPCPMMPSEASPVKIGDLERDLSAWQVIDARPDAAKASQHIPGARVLPYHPIKSPDADVLAGLKALGPNSLLVVGDTAIDSGRLLAAELSEAGCLGVRYLEGGFAAWREAGRPVEGPAEEGGAAEGEPVDGEQGVAP